MSLSLSHRFAFLPFGRSFEGLITWDLVDLLALAQAQVGVLDLEALGLAGLAVISSLHVVTSSAAAGCFETAAARYLADLVALPDHLDHPFNGKKVVVVESDNVDTDVETFYDGYLAAITDEEGGVTPSAPPTPSSPSPRTRSPSLKPKPPPPPLAFPLLLLLPLKHPPLLPCKP
ncbi:hypothetical protein MUK42_33505 [Musa troglodytarum]|uniref:Uncharacterized protein n=1 Tax=Musa troglodytarum TaxID=320322 RepID=A0A9E7F852_9LILI|nr:hypothetical protein MUK42_33505 [Musa troglodytarum]